MPNLNKMRGGRGGSHPPSSSNPAYGLSQVGTPSIVIWNFSWAYSHVAPNMSNNIDQDEVYIARLVWFYDLFYSTVAPSSNIMYWVKKTDGDRPCL